MHRLLCILLCFAMASACGEHTPKGDSPKTTGEGAPVHGATLETASPAGAEGKAKTKKAEAPRLVTLGGSVTETVFALGHGDRVVGVDVSSVHPAPALKLPKVGYYRRISAEGVLSLKPDLILASEATGPPAVVQKLKDVGMRIEFLPEAKDLDGSRARIKSLATLLGEEDKGRELLAQIDAELDGVKRPKEPKKALFIYARGAGTLNVAGAKTSADELIRLAGGTNAVQGYEGYKPLNAESLVAAAPDVLLFTSRGLESIGGVEGALSLEGVSLTPAGKTRSIVGMDDLKLLGFGPRVGQAAAELAKLLNSPDAPPKP